MGIVDILGEILTTALIDQEYNKGKRGGCSIWFAIFLLAFVGFIGWVFFTQE